ncbi:MAG TPA: 3-hydroxyacyl-CoA dehydrogenase NAD-binding domain-containing protein [Actinomycetota bacterium]|nr:3-hydroxyacyl-CoA dehydrogenase NAD-binding domain-containing protein [Actinomycetota bacterium]
MATDRPVGVVGAGVMGTGVAQSLAEHGVSVVLVDVDETALERVAPEIRKGMSMSALLGGVKASPEEVLALIQTTASYESLRSVRFVIENATEDVGVKSSVYPRLDEVCPPDAVFAVNTSAIQIGRLAALTKRPDKVIGMHLMNPVPLKPTVEVIRSAQTSDETVATSLELLRSIGKEGIVVNDSPGFVSNRVLMLTVNEAIAVLADGVAPAADIDRIFKTCFGHKMGPLETADLIGLDTILNSLVVLRDSFGDAKYEPHPLLVKKVEAGEHGRKSGHGFYDYGTAR